MIPTAEIPQLAQQETLVHHVDVATRPSMTEIMDKMSDQTNLLKGTSDSLVFGVSVPEAVNDSPGVQMSQKLHGLVQSGSEVFSVIEAIKHETNDSQFLLARTGSKQGQRPTIYSVLPFGEPVTVGRTTDTSLDSATSRQHFRVTINEKGIAVEDLDTTNGTALLSGDKLLVEDQLPKGNVSARTVVKGLLRRVVSKKQNDYSGSKKHDTLEIQQWSVKSADVRKLVDSAEPPVLETPARIHVFDHDRTFAISMYDKLSSGVTSIQKAQLRNIILQGKFDGKQADDAMTRIRYGTHDRIMNRLGLAKLYLESPEEARLLADDQVIGFHGTRSAALAGIFKEGYLGSGAHLRQQEAFVYTGEHVFQSKEGQAGISFSTFGSLDQGALGYSGRAAVPRTLSEIRADFEKQKERAWATDDSGKVMVGEHMQSVLEAIDLERERSLALMEANPDGLEAQLTAKNFPVLIATNEKALENLDEVVAGPGGRINRGGVVMGESSMGEFRLMTEKVDREGIPLILVPESEIIMVRDICQKYGFNATRIAPIEPYLRATHKASVFNQPQSVFNQQQ